MFQAKNIPMEILIFLFESFEIWTKKKEVCVRNLITTYFICWWNFVSLPKHSIFMFSKSKYFSPTTYMNFRFFLVNFQTPTLSIFDISMHDYMIVCYTMYIYIYETLPSNLLYIMQFFFPYKHISTCTTKIWCKKCDFVFGISNFGAVKSSIDSCLVSVLLSKSECDS